MKRENINYIVVGSFVVVMLVAFFVVMYQVTGRSGPTEQYFVMYSNVTGVKYGTPVLYEGFQVGQVEQIQPVRESGKTRYQLTLAVVGNHHRYQGREEQRQFATGWFYRRT